MDGFTACQRELLCRCSIIRRGYLAAQWQPQLGAGAALAIGTIVQRYAAVMAFDHLAHEAQPQPGALAGVRSG